MNCNFGPHAVQGCKVHIGNEVGSRDCIYAGIMFQILVLDLTLGDCQNGMVPELTHGMTLCPVTTVYQSWKHDGKV